MKSFVNFLGLFLLGKGLAAALVLRSSCAWQGGFASLGKDEISGLVLGCWLPGEARLARHRSLC